jgi:squalene-hopene/tetraprenyl-beta-curcumene cyclase
MNTMELVRFVERAEPRSSSRREATPLFYTQLAGPARQAILRARQHLLSEQAEDGSWCGLQTGDASLSSQLIFLLAFAGAENSPLLQQAAATILDMQLPDGGWSRGSAGAADIGVSCQAYFALKLSGMDPTDERLHPARQVIRDLGGAEAADMETRYFLALFGQMNYDTCYPNPPELVMFAGATSAWRLPVSLVWAHRAARPCNLEHGVRELFLGRTQPWRISGKLRRWRRAIFAAVCHYCERKGWTPLRRLALEKAESYLYKRVKPAVVNTLSFRELVWIMIALRTIGHSTDSALMRLCQKRFEELVRVDEVHDRAAPQPRTTPVPDTLSALHALRASGVAAAHPCISSALRYLSRTRRLVTPATLAEIIGFLRLISSVKAENLNRNNALPPDIEVRNRYSNHRANRRLANTIANRVRPLVASLVERVLREQNRDGSWGGVAETARALEAIAQADFAGPRDAFDRAAALLRRKQRADGSWVDDTGESAFVTTSWAIRGLIACGVPAEDDAIAAALNWLRVYQRPDGAWGEPVSPAQSAAALSAIVAAGRPNHPAALRAVDYLVKTQNERGGWDDRNLLLRDTAAGESCGNALHATAEPLFALSRWAIAAAFAHSQESSQSAFKLVGTAADD